MEWVEVTAKTVEEAKDKALDYLGVDEAQAEFEILEEPRVTGLFRRVKGEARVRARIRPVRPRPKAERRDRRRGRAGGGREGREGGGRDGTDRDGTGRDNAERRPSRQPADADTSPSLPASDAGNRDRGARRSSRPSPDGDAGAPVTRPVPHAPAPRTTTRQNVVVQEGSAEMAGEETNADETEELETAGDSSTRDASDEQAAAEQAEDARSFVAGVVDAFGFDATVEVVHVDDHLDEVRVTGQDLGLLLGPRAATLDAIQELTRVVAQRRGDGRSDSRLRVDVGGYRQRRKEALERFVLTQADEVRSTGVQKVLEPMGSSDRKVVHDTVGTLDGVRSVSEGEDPRRRVVIVPA